MEEIFIYFDRELFGSGYLLNILSNLRPVSRGSTLNEKPREDLKRFSRRPETINAEY